MKKVIETVGEKLKNLLFCFFFKYLLYEKLLRKNNYFTDEYGML